ncbi:ubiquinol-cytochrome-c reductase complex subunit-domain-containing protein [Dichotomocladium elegans]|nr:ubiquinol-cytochrome-c reductase complex subunit-domain-containing protein [Dichotomocladium elegans]
MPVAKIATNPHFGIFTIEKLVRAVPTLAVWGAAAGSAAMLFGSNVPLIQKDILSKIPVLGANWPVAEANDEE